MGLLVIFANSGAAIIDGGTEDRSNVSIIFIILSPFLNTLYACHARKDI